MLKCNPQDFWCQFVAPNPPLNTSVETAVKAVDWAEDHFVYWKGDGESFSGILKESYLLIIH